MKKFFKNVPWAPKTSWIAGGVVAVGTYFGSLVNPSIGFGVYVGIAMLGFAVFHQLLAKSRT